VWLTRCFCREVGNFFPQLAIFCPNKWKSSWNYTGNRFSPNFTPHTKMRPQKKSCWSIGSFFLSFFPIFLFCKSGEFFGQWNIYIYWKKPPKKNFQLFLQKFHKFPQKMPTIKSPIKRRLRQIWP
jgi:hypothetical protein